MRFKKSRFPNLMLSAIVIATIGIIAHNYSTNWSATYAQATLDHKNILTENHSNISANLDLKFPAENDHCLTCHQGIAPTRPLNSGMMKQILKIGNELGDLNGCVVCHGGNPAEKMDKNIAHSGAPAGGLLKEFTPVPGALQINESTCGQCHEDHTYNVHRSMMNTDAGKMKAITWSFGIGTENKDHIYGDHDMDDPDGDVPRFGSDRYKGYMKEMAIAFRGNIPAN